MPHGQCFLWEPWLLWSHVISDLIIFLAYYSIPVLLLYFIKKRTDIQFGWMFSLFGSFIVLCGTTHLIAIVTIWQPVFWLAAFFKGITALVSIVTAYLLWLLLPKLIALPSPSQLEAVNKKLNDEIIRHKETSKQYANKVKELEFQQSALDAHAIVSIADVKGNITYVNHKFETVSQYSSEELLGQNHRILNSATHSDSFFKEMWAVIAKGNIWQGQIQNKAKDGSLYWVSSTIVPDIDEQGKPKQYIALRTDITEIKSLEMKQQNANHLLLAEQTKTIQEKKRFQILFEKSGNGLVLLDEGQFINCNEAAVRLMGYATKAELMKSPAALSPEYQPDGRLSAEKTQEMDAICLSEGTNLFEWMHQKQDGTNFWVEVLLTRLDYEEKQIILVSWRDISLQKQLLIENEKIKNDAIKSNLAKSEFLSSMSHELRTPLNAILGFSQLLEMGEDEQPLSEDQKSSVNYILSSGHHLLTLINDVLELSAIEAGKTVLSIEPIQLIDVIADSVSLITPIATKANIHIHVASDSRLTVNADNTKLKQILINLISNAIKYNHKEGNVTIDWKPVKNNMVRINVTDTGIGISEENQNKVFNAFNRLGQENSNIEGTGIGLSVTKELVEMMAGEIGVHSIDEHQGTTFWFELPLIDEVEYEHEHIETKVMKIEESSKNIDDSSDIKAILYVEDNPANRQLMQSFFKRQKNYNLTLVETGELGWEVALEQDFDLILMDIHLPEIDGKALTEKLRETSQYKNQPIVAMTAAAMTHDIQAADGLFDDYLTKPIEIPKLLNTLKKYLS